MNNEFVEFRTIPIDFEVFKALTARLESPSDSYNGVLRRLLELSTLLPPTPSAASGSGQSWVVGGATFPDGAEFRARYKGRIHTARVRDGALVYNGVTYDAPSPAAIAVTGNSVNGWNFWECRLPGTDRWAVISGFRRKQP